MERPDGFRRNCSISQSFPSNSSHTLIRITPNNQARWKSDPRFGNKDSRGRHYATLGAGPGYGSLISNVNRPSDVAPHDDGLSLDDPRKCTDEDLLIENLFDLDSKFPDNLDYDLYPANPQDASIFWADDGYNSNSYISGLIDAAGLPKPVLPGNLSFPGWNKPVPMNFFR